MTDPTTPETEWWQNKAKWLSGFWIIRGIGITFTTLSIAAVILDLSQYEIFEAVHVLISSWNKLISIAAEALSRIPFLPDIPPAALATTIFIASLWMPGITAIFLVLRDIKNGDEFILSHFPRVFLALRMFMFASAILIIPAALISFYDIYSGGDGSGGHAFPNLALDGVTKPKNGGENPNYQLHLSILVITLISSIFIKFPNMRKSILFCTGILLCVEFCYYFGSPYLSEEIRNFICDLGDLSTDRCRPGT